MRAGHSHVFDENDFEELMRHFHNSAALVFFKTWKASFKSDNVNIQARLWADW